MKFIFKIIFPAILLFTSERDLYAENLNKIYTSGIKTAKSDSTITSTAESENNYTQLTNETISGEINNFSASASSDLTENTDSREFLIGSSSDNTSETRAELDDTKNQRLNKTSFYKIGFILTILGFVLGFMFGRAAFLIATTGIVFLVIRYFI